MSLHRRHTAPEKEVDVRQVTRTLAAPRPHWVGDGFPVHSLLSYAEHGDQISPFLLLDHAGPHEFPAAKQPRGVGEHPHRGFETVTIVYSGEVAHRDSTGAGGVIGAGDVQWMTAASGILHEEFHSEAFTASGGTLEMVQLWVNLPARDKNVPPAYQTLNKADIPVVDLDGGAGSARVIAGTYAGVNGPARTFTPIEILDVRLAPGKLASFDLPDGHNVAVVVLSGTVEINGESIVRQSGAALLEPTGGAFTLEAAGDAKLLVLAGAPIREPVVAHGPFVMNTIGEIKQAMLDYQNGRFGQIA